MIEESGVNVSAEGGYYGNALQAASERGHEKVMQLLIENERTFMLVVDIMAIRSRRHHGQVMRM